MIGYSHSRLTPSTPSPPRILRRNHATRYTGCSNPNPRRKRMEKHKNRRQIKKKRRISRGRNEQQQGLRERKSKRNKKRTRKQRPTAEAVATNFSTSQPLSGQLDGSFSYIFLTFLYSRAPARYGLFCGVLFFLVFTLRVFFVFCFVVFSLPFHSVYYIIIAMQSHQSSVSSCQNQNQNQNQK